MKKIRTIIILCVLMVAFIGAYFVVDYIKDNEVEADTSDGETIEDEDETNDGYGHIYEFDESDLESVIIENDLGTITFIATIVEEEEESDDTDDTEDEDEDEDEDDDDEDEDDTEVEWVIEGHEEWTLNSSLVSATIEIASEVFANRQADEDASSRDLSEFGLDDPCSIITVNLRDGTTQTIYVGDLTPSGSYYYGMVEGDDSIYTIGRNAGKTANYTAESYRYVNSITIDVDEGEIYYLLIENSNGRNTEVNYVGIYDEGDTLEYYNAGTYTLSYGENFAYNKVLFVTGNLDDIFAALPETVSISEQIEDNCEDLDQYGLGETPEHQVTLTYRVQVDEDEVSSLAALGYDISMDDAVEDEETGYSYFYYTQIYTFGYEYTNDDGEEMVYFRFSESDDVFGVEKSIVDQFDFEPYSYVQRVLYLNNIDNVESMTVTIAGEEHDLEFKRGEVYYDEDSDEQQDVVYKVDGVLCDEDLFKDFYQALIGVMSDYEIYDEEFEIDEDDYYTIDYVFTDGSTYTITYYRMNDFYYVTQVSEDAWFACTYTQFQDIDELLDECVNGTDEDEEEDDD